MRGLRAKRVVDSGVLGRTVKKWVVSAVWGWLESLTDTVVPVGEWNGIAVVACPEASD